MRQFRRITPKNCNNDATKAVVRAADEPMPVLDTIGLPVASTVHHQ
jgi:hypothetical protein